MSFCKHCKVRGYSEVCICEIEQDVCPFVRRCTTHLTWLPLESMDRCNRRFVPLQSRKENVVLKNGEYRVEYVQHNKLYINIDGSLVRMINPYDYEPDKVELVRIDGKIYIKEFAPETKEEKVEKKSTKPKKKNNE